MSRNNKRIGEIRIHAERDNIWEHEMQTARALAKAGYMVEFPAVSSDIKSPDIIMLGEWWEIKSPRSQKLPSVERNLKCASHQSRYVVFDSRRMGRLPDKSIQKELVRQFVNTKSIENILFINRKQEVIDISKLV